MWTSVQLVFQCYVSQSFVIVTPLSVLSRRVNFVMSQKELIILLLIVLAADVRALGTNFSI